MRGLAIVVVAMLTSISIFNNNAAALTADVQINSSHGWYEDDDYRMILNMSFVYENIFPPTDFTFYFTLEGDGDITPDTQYFNGIYGSGEIPFQENIYIPNPSRNSMYTLRITGTWQAGASGGTIGGSEAALVIPQRYELEVDGFTLFPEDPQKDDHVSVSATISNKGNGQDTISVELLVDGEVTDNKTITLDEDSSSDITLTWLAEPGDHNITIRATSHTSGAEIVEVSTLLKVGMISSSDYANIGIGLTIVVLLAAIIFILRRRRR